MPCLTSLALDLSTNRVWRVDVHINNVTMRCSTFDSEMRRELCVSEVCPNACAVVVPSVGSIVNEWTWPSRKTLSFDLYSHLRGRTQCQETLTEARLSFTSSH